MKINVSAQPFLLNDLIEGLGQAEGACSQLVHALQDPRFMVIRESIELAKEGVISVATFNASLITSVKK